MVKLVKEAPLTISNYQQKEPREAPRECTTVSPSNIAAALMFFSQFLVFCSFCSHAHGALTFSRCILGGATLITPGRLFLEWEMDIYSLFFVTQKCDQQLCCIKRSLPTLYYRRLCSSLLADNTEGVVQSCMAYKV